MFSYRHGYQPIQLCRRSGQHRCSNHRRTTQQKCIFSFNLQIILLILGYQRRMEHNFLYCSRRFRIHRTLLLNIWLR